MLGASTMVHQPHGFFMNWFGKQQGEFTEYHVLVIGIAAAWLVTGAGRWSIDREVSARIAD
jgi:putative oxidoreductase